MRGKRNTSAASTDRMIMTDSFKTLHLRPEWLQFIIDEWPGILVFMAAVICLGAESWRGMPLLLFLTVTSGIYLLLAFLMLRRKLFILTSETLVYDRGIFFRRADFIELYRVIDFQERQSLLQQLAGLKTVVVYSGDRTTPQLLIPGVRQEEDLIRELRERVEYNKTRRGVYEITNRY